MSGVYQCEASGVEGKVKSSQVQVIIQYGPRAATILRNHQTISGDVTETEDTSRKIPLNCSSDCNPLCKIAWYKDGEQEDSYNPVIDIRRDRRMSGVYQCEASGVEGKVKSSQVQVIIQYGPRAATILRNHQTISGDVTETEDTSRKIPLNCSSDCNPLCKIAWYKDGEQEDSYNPVIDIRRDRRMSGVYQCEASGVEGKVKSSQVQVIIQYGPRAATILRNHQTISGDVTETEDTSRKIPLNCSSDCNPLCKIAWYKDGEQEDSYNPVIDIRRDRRMSGVYQCEASGVEGKVKSSQVQVIIQS
ncbi:hemicentin-2-like [Crassostrea angulata]|uniref:hemicentin-2-like n=1 Tax=Magallana angulata TaxID=2784310 RepID=UPI0022B1A64B|nr:hemicentin-2-like [Crassostrea angulata]